MSDHYKVLGELAAVDGIGVLGRNTADSGTSHGLRGEVSSSEGYGLSTPDDAMIDGDIETTSGHQLTVDGVPALRLGPASLDDFDFQIGGNVIGGYQGNTAGNAVGATIGGGGRENNPNTVNGDYATVSGGENNTASGSRSTVGGGDANTASATDATVGGGDDNTASGNYSTVGGGSVNDAGEDYTTVGGGDANTASGVFSTVGGGKSNTASRGSSTVGGGSENTADGPDSTVSGGESNEAFATHSTIGGGKGNRAGKSGAVYGNYATVPGGRNNVALEDSSFAAGQRAKARDSGAFVWADERSSEFGSDQTGTSGSPTGVNTFHVRATGGIRFVTGLDSNDDPNAGQYLDAGGSTWQTVSAASAKHDVRPVDPEEVLSGVESLSVSRWAYDANPGVDRMGPMAGEFSEAFELGDDPETIGHVDADGVALAAIKGLAERLHGEGERLDEIEEQTESLRAENRQLRDRNEELEARLERLESAVRNDGLDARKVADE